MNPSYNITFNPSRPMRTKDDHVPDGIHHEVFDFNDDVNYKEPRYCNSKDCSPVGIASFTTCISGICQDYCSGDWC